MGRLRRTSGPGSGGRDSSHGESQGGLGIRSGSGGPRDQAPRARTGGPSQGSGVGDSSHREAQKDLGTRSGSQGAGEQERLKRISGPGARVGDSSTAVAPGMTEKSAREEKVLRRNATNETTNECNKRVRQTGQQTSATDECNKQVLQTSATNENN